MVTCIFSRAIAWLAQSAYLCSKLPYLWLTNAARRRMLNRQALPGVLDLGDPHRAGLTLARLLLSWWKKASLIHSFIQQVLHHMQMDSHKEPCGAWLPDASRPEVYLCSTIQASAGTSISSTLILLANQIRVNQSHRAEAKANQAPVKLLFPLIFFIFPSLLVVLFGPVLLGGTF